MPMPQETKRRDACVAHEWRFVGPTRPLEAYEAQLLLAAGDVSGVRAAPMWRRITALK